MVGFAKNGASRQIDPGLTITYGTFLIDVVSVCVRILG